MTDHDQSSATARRPYRQNGDPSSQSTDKRGSAWSRLKALLSFRPASLRSEIQSALEEPQDEGEDAFSASERTILQNVLKLAETRVEDVMIPRADIEALEAFSTIGAAVLRFREAGHSRLPVYEGNLDKITGMVHIKDVLDRLTEVSRPDPSANSNGAEAGNGSGAGVKLVPSALDQEISRRGLVRKLLFVPPSMPITDLLASMQAARIHMAVVVDEYGGTDGLVTIEDLLEAVVGNIEDEHDEDDATMLRAVDADTYIVNARIELEELAAGIGRDFDVSAWIEDVDTLGGLIFTLVGRVPVRGEVITEMPGFEFEILRADPRRVRLVRIRRKHDVIEALPAPDAFADPAENGDGGSRETAQQR